MVDKDPDEIVEIWFNGWINEDQRETKGVFLTTEKQDTEN